MNSDNNRTKIANYIASQQLYEITDITATYAREFDRKDCGVSVQVSEALF